MEILGLREGKIFMMEKNLSIGYMGEKSRKDTKKYKVIENAGSVIKSRRITSGSKEIRTDANITDFVLVKVAER